MSQQISGITADPIQQLGLLLPDGSQVQWTLTYRPQQQGWYYDISWPNPTNPTSPFNLQGVRLVCSPNILRQYRNQIPFGIMISTVGSVEPVNPGDFQNGVVTAILLAAADVALVESTLFPGS